MSNYVWENWLPKDAVFVLRRLFESTNIQYAETEDARWMCYWMVEEFEAEPDFVVGDFKLYDEDEEIVLNVGEDWFWFDNFDDEEDEETPEQYLQRIQDTIAIALAEWQQLHPPLSTQLSLI